MPPKKPLPVKPKPAPIRGETSSVSEIFVAFFRLCKERLLHVMAVMLLAAAASLLLLAALGFGWISVLGMDLGQVQQFFIGGGLQELLANPQNAIAHALLLAGGLVMLLAVFLLWSWCYTAMLAAAVDEHHGIIESLCTGWKHLFPMLWVSTLFFGIALSWGCIVGMLFPLTTAVLSSVIPTPELQNLNFATGSMLALGGVISIGLIFFLLISVIPLSMIFGFIVMIDEGHSNIDALLISRLYVRGHWWDTLFKLFLVCLLLILIQMPLLLLPLFAPFPGHQFVAQAVSFVTTPLLLLYMVAIYRDLKKATGKVEPDLSCRCLWRMMAAAGILLPLLAVIGAAVTGGPKMFSGGTWKAMGTTAPAPDAVSNSPSTAEKAEGDAPQALPAPPVDNPVIWRDLTGDASNPLLDIREVSAIGKQNELTLTVTLAKPFAEYFAASGRESYAQLINFYLDVDRNETTGAALPSAQSGRAGYDFELDVLLAVPHDKPETGNAYPSLYALAPQKRQSLAPLPDSIAAIADNTLTIHLPYERLDAVTGGRLRICFREAAQTEGGLSNDQSVPLK